MQPTEAVAKGTTIANRSLYVMVLFSLLLSVLGAACLFQWVAAMLPGIKSGAAPSSYLGTAVLYSVLGATVALMMLIATGPKTPSFSALLSNLYRRFRHALWTLGRALGVRRYTARELVTMTIIASTAAVLFLPVVQWLESLPFGPGWAPADDDPRFTRLEEAAVPVQFLHSFINAPAVEEVMFRGPLLVTAFLLGSGVAKRDISPRWRAVLLAGTAITLTVLFGAAHAASNGSNVVSAGLAGIVFAWLALRYKSLLPCLIFHGLYNGLETIL